MMRFAVLLAATIIAAFSTSACGEYRKMTCPDSINTAAMRALWNDLLLGAPQGSKEDAKVILSRVPKLREWANSLSDPCEKWAYLIWIRFQEDQAKTTLDDEAAKVRAQNEEEWNSRRQQEDADADAALQRITKPPQFDYQK